MNYAQLLVKFYLALSLGHLSDAAQMATRYRLSPIHHLKVRLAYMVNDLSCTMAYGLAELSRTRHAALEALSS